MAVKKTLRTLFTQNLGIKQKQYEALRMFALENKTYGEVAKKFGYTPEGLRSLASLTAKEKINFFTTKPVTIHKSGPSKLYMIKV